MDIIDFTPEQVDILKAGFQDFDFTKVLPLTPENDFSPEEAKAKADFKKRLMEYMTEVLPTMNIKRNMANFARDQPVNLLMDADADYMAELSMEALLHSDENGDETGTDPESDEILDYVLDKIIELLEYAVQRYCEAKGKTEEELTAEDGKIIFDRVMKLISENTLCAIMLGQQFPEIHEISHDMCTAEDFGKKRNSNDYKNFINHWYHLKTEIGAMLSFESLSEYTECLDSEEADYRILRNAYYESLNEVDARIFTLCEAGYKQEEIAQILGYKSQATVAKHLKSMRSQLDTFLDDSQA